MTSSNYRDVSRNGSEERVVFVRSIGPAVGLVNLEEVRKGKKKINKEKECGSVHARKHVLLKIVPKKIKTNSHEEQG